MDGNANDEGNEEGKEDNSTKTLFDKTNDATDRQEEANKKTEELLNRQEDLYAKQKLGGQSMAGNTPIQKSEEQNKTDNALEMFKGTALGDAIGKANE